MPKQQRILRFTLPVPPSINEQYATVNGLRVSTVVARRFKEQVKLKMGELARTGQLSESLRAALRQGYLGLYLAFYFETPLKRDLDGGLKITQDAICEHLGLNDNRIVTIHLVKYIEPLHPHLEVELEAIEDWKFDEEYRVL